MNRTPPFSVLMSVYRNDNPEHFQYAVKSIWNDQTVKPSEIVLVVDGPVRDELKLVINSFEKNISPMRVVWLKENHGLGLALRAGMETVKNEIVARMDSDDIASSNRFELQLDYLISHPEIGILGGQISEFVDTKDNVVGKRNVPLFDPDLKFYMKKRCPFNHMTVMFRKSEVMKAGNYLHWHYNEDYYLWLRLALAGVEFANLPETLVNVRVGIEMYQRRGGWKYFKSEKEIQIYMLKHRIISVSRYCYNVFGRFIIQVAMPNRLRGFIFQKLLRN